MDKQNYWVVGGIAAIILLTLAIFYKSDKTNYSWKESYDVNEKSPYGLYVLHELFNNYPSNNVVKKVSKNLEELSEAYDNEEADNYVFIGQALNLDSLALENLLDFIASGNTAFISSKTIPSDFMNRIYPEICYQYDWTDYIYRQDTLVTLNLTHGNLQDTSGFEFKYFRNFTVEDYYWKYIDPDYFCDTITSLVELGAINNEDINFARKQYGDGHVYIHTTPISFTNFHLIDSLGIDYAGNVFSHLGPGQIYWDEINKVEELVGRRRNRSNSDMDQSLISDGPLSFIMEKRSLRAAWYTLLALALLFLLFRTRRKQRIIPILPVNRNTSLDFISTIGSLYFLQHDHGKLCKKQGKLFLNYIRTHYDIPTQNLDEQFTKRLSAKSEVSEDIIDKILTLWNNLKLANQVTENTMVDFYKLLNHFYKTCK